MRIVKNNQKSVIYLTGSLLFIGLVIFNFHAKSPKLSQVFQGGIANAEEEEEEEEDEQEDVAREAQASSGTSSTTETKQVVTPPRTVVKTIIENVVYPDSDRDGLSDKDDPHPAIAEVYIVKDQNGNGIDDYWEGIN